MPLLNRCDGVVYEPRDAVPRDSVDQSEAEDAPKPSVHVNFASLQVSTKLDGTERPLFEDISDAEDDGTETSSPVQAADISTRGPSPLSLFHSAVGPSSTFDDDDSWLPSTSDNCSSSLPAASPSPSQPVHAVGSLVPKVEAPFYPDLTSPPLPPLDDMVTGSNGFQDGVGSGESGADVPKPLAIVGRDVSPEVDGGLQVMSDQASSTALMSPDSRLDAPSPPKIPRLRIVMGAAGTDCGQSSTSPGGSGGSGSSSSVPYVMTVDEPATHVATSLGGRDVTDDVTESAESGSGQRRKVNHGVSAKVRSFQNYIVAFVICHRVTSSLSMRTEYRFDPVSVFIPVRN